MTNDLLPVMVVALVLTIVVVWLIMTTREHHDRRRPMNEPVIQSYPDKGVKVTVGWQGYAVQVLRIPQATLEEMRSAQDEFQPRRLLLNVVVARTDDADRLVTKFEPPLQLEIAYSQEDLEVARKHDLAYPQIGFWDGCKWVLFRENKHGLRYVTAERTTTEVAGYAVVTLSEWSDPSIGAGPP
ncbi:hypothetical protein TFLX_04880 [Thermoflexales bacterium]|nr:hypothetical protein TFLX_04880 [Thermoflexales bacterium]